MRWFGKLSTILAENYLLKKFETKLSAGRQFTRLSKTLLNFRNRISYPGWKRDHQADKCTLYRCSSIMLMPVIFLFKCKMAWDFCPGFCLTNKPLFHAFQCILVKSQKISMNSAGEDLRISNVVDLWKNFPRDNYGDMHIVHGTVLFWHGRENLSWGQVLSLWLCEIVDNV